MISSHIKRRRVTNDIQSGKNTLRNVPNYHKNLLNRQNNNGNGSSSATPTLISQSVLVGLVEFGIILGLIIFLTVIIGIIAFFYRRRLICKQLTSDDSLIGHDWDDYYYYSNNESGLFNDKYGGIIVNTTNTVETNSRDSITSNTSNTIKYIKSIYNEKSSCLSTSELPSINPDYNNNYRISPPASVYNMEGANSMANNIRIAPPALTLISTNYKQPKDVQRGTSNTNENWFTKPIDSPTMPLSPSRTSLKSLQTSNWSKAPWQDDLIQLPPPSLIKYNETSNLHSNIDKLDKLDKTEVPNKEASLNRFSLFEDFKRVKEDSNKFDENNL